MSILASSVIICHWRLVAVLAPSDVERLIVFPKAEADAASLQRPNNLEDNRYLSTTLSLLRWACCALATTQYKITRRIRLISSLFCTRLTTVRDHGFDRRVALTRDHHQEVCLPLRVLLNVACDLTRFPQT